MNFGKARTHLEDVLGEGLDALERAGLGEDELDLLVRQREVRLGIGCVVWCGVVWCGVVRRGG
jgi:hypothetical protein